MNLPAKLTSLRKQKGMTQLELAEILNVSRQAVSRWEAGSAVPSTDNLKILSDLYGVSVDYLLDDGVDDFCGNTENHRQEEKEQKWPESKKYRCALGCIVVLIMIIIGLVCAVLIPMRKQKQEGEIIPIGEMDTIIDDDYPVYTFSFDEG